MNLRTSIIPQRTPYSFSSVTLLNPARPRPPIYFCLSNLIILDISHKCTDTICSLLCLDSFTQHNIFRVHACCSMYQQSFSRLSNIPSYVYSVFCSSIHPLMNTWVAAIMNNAAVNIPVEFLCGHIFSSSLKTYLRGTAKSYI